MTSFAANLGGFANSAVNMYSKLQEESRKNAAEQDLADARERKNNIAAGMDDSTGVPGGAATAAPPSAAPDTGAATGTPSPSGGVAPQLTSAPVDSSMAGAPARGIAVPPTGDGPPPPPPTGGIAPPSAAGGIAAPSAAGGIAAPSAGAAPAPTAADATSYADRVILRAKAMAGKPGASDVLQAGYQLKDTEQKLAASALTLRTATESATRQTYMNSLLDAARIPDPLASMVAGVAAVNKVDPATITAHFVDAPPGPNGQPADPNAPKSIQVTNTKTGAVVGQASDPHSFFAPAFALASPEGYLAYNQQQTETKRLDSVAAANIRLAGAQATTAEYTNTPGQRALADGVKTSAIRASNASSTASLAAAGASHEQGAALAASRQIATQSATMLLSLRNAVASAPPGVLHDAAAARLADFEGKVPVPTDVMSGGVASTVMKYPDGHVEPWSPAAQRFLPSSVGSDFTKMTGAVTADSTLGNPQLVRLNNGAYGYIQPGLPTNPHGQPQQFTTWQQAGAAFKANTARTTGAHVGIGGILGSARVAVGAISDAQRMNMGLPPLPPGR